MKTDPFYQERATCREETKQTPTCICPSGYTGHLCKTALPNQCFVQITQPNLAAGCSEQFEDSDYYVYSIQGYDPCYFFNLEKKTTIKYKLTCQAINSNFEVIEGGHPEGLGFKYSDILDPALIDTDVFITAD